MTYIPKAFLSKTSKVTIRYPLGKEKGKKEYPLGEMIVNIKV